MEKTAHVKVNFFKPITEHAKSNMKLIITLAIIWAVAVFGFQILLIALNKPVPEENFSKFEKIWPEIADGTNEDTLVKQEMSNIVLSVLGKNIALKQPHKDVLKLTISKLIIDLLPEEQKSLFAQDPLGFLAGNDLHEILGLEKDGLDKLRYDLLPESLVSVENADFTPEIKEQIPSIMQLYLVHNRSFLTDFSFIGFPFHYWYTAQFLLIMFVVLCIIYAVAIDKLHKKHNIDE